jgi:UDP-2-acetamido-2,6-beta-L-arabino-hexul-4-ose reductase
MPEVAVTGATGFIGKNLRARLAGLPDIRVTALDRQALGEGWEEALARALARAEVVYHLAGEVRPRQATDYDSGNAGITGRLLACLAKTGARPRLAFVSSTQAEGQGAYGESKRRCEEAIGEQAARRGFAAHIFRLPNVFGKWARPDHNSVVATFCRNVALDRPLRIDDPDARLRLVYIDDVAAALLGVLGAQAEPGARFETVEPVFTASVGDLARRILEFRDLDRTLAVPDCSDPFTRRLYATYRSYQPAATLCRELTEHADARGKLAEVVRSAACGQVFVSRTAPGQTRGNHYHHSKVEKFCVLSGQADVALSAFEGDNLVFAVSGERFCVVDIPPGYAHKIVNTGTTDLITLFWANQAFNPDDPDTFAREV